VVDQLPGAEQADFEERRGPFRPGRLVSSRSRLQGRLVARGFQAGDAVAVATAAWVAHSLAPIEAAQVAFLIGPLAVLASLGMIKAYDFPRSQGFAHHLTRLLLAFAVAGAVSLACLLPLRPANAVFAAMAAWAPFTLVVLYLTHAVWWLAIRRWRANGRLIPNVVVVGATGAAERLIARLLETRDVAVLGVFDDRAARSPDTIKGVPVLGGTAALIDHRIMPYVARVVITVPARARARVRGLIAQLRVLPNEITLLLEAEGEAGEDAAISRIADAPLAHISGAPVDHGRALVKRAQDLVLGSIALVAAAPLMLLLAVAVRLDSPGPALFRQRRHGFNNEEIVVWKFRSMRTEAADPHARRQVSADDDRVTRLGRLIRRTSLDELPQILNVLKGEMSLVGPRPHAVGMTTGDVESARLVAEYAHRHRMKPGMTGWAAIQGSRGPVDTPELVRRRVALDVEYIERQSFWLDIYIMAMTLPCLLGDRQAVR
jgi:Undecaprenyl-phosphate glucose phosphotransferase